MLRWLNAKQRQLRTRGDGTTAFDDGLGEASGEWVTGRTPSAEPGLLFYIMVDDAPAADDAVKAPGGNVVGIYQDRA